MFDALKNWLSEADQDTAAKDDGSARLVADLLVEAAAADGHIDAGESELITRLLAERFDLDAEAADQLLELAHDRNWDPFDRSIDIRISRLRRKIEENPKYPRYLQTARGVGYILMAD